MELNLIMSDFANENSNPNRANNDVDDKSDTHWPYVGESPAYAPLSPWTRFQGGGFYMMMLTIFGICWTILCGAGIYFGMRNVAIAKSIGFWTAVELRAGTGLWLWFQVWLYPMVATQAASLLIRFYYKKKCKPLHQSINPGPIGTTKL